VTNTKHYAGTDSATNNTVQETTFGYDGHGRLQTRHLPQQAFGRNTAYEYYLDDQVKKMTDARGAVTNFEYEGRGLLKTVSYAAPTNNEGLTPWLYRVDRVNGGNTLVVLGENFATNVEVVASTWTNNGTVQELARYSGTQLTRGTQENRETIAFQITQQSVIDALNQYNLRLQVINSDTKQQSYDVPLNVNSSQNPGFGWGSPEIVTPAGSVNYQYDNLGNITSMQDELGTLTYQYDQLSRISSETRYITALNQSYQTSYGYELSGQLKTVTDPFNAAISYTFNKSGGLTAVNGTNYGISTPFISNIEYRAWGGIKKADYGYGAQLNMTYDER
jgi:YD repeat-containing protein